MNMRVLAIDPGVRSGWVYWDGQTLSDCGEADQMGICGIISTTEADVVVIEAYRIMQSTLRESRQTASLEIIGAARYLAHRKGAKFILQTAGDAKAFITDSKLRKLGWYFAGLGHARDAARHLGLYLAKHEHNREVLSA